MKSQAEVAASGPDSTGSARGFLCNQKGRVSPALTPGSTLQEGKPSLLISSLAWIPGQPLGHH